MNRVNRRNEYCPYHWECIAREEHGLCRLFQFIAQEVFITWHTSGSKREQYHEIFNWFRWREAARDFPAGRPECDRRMKFQEHLARSLAVAQNRSKDIGIRPHHLRPTAPATSRNEQTSDSLDRPAASATFAILETCPIEITILSDWPVNYPKSYINGLTDERFMNWRLNASNILKLLQLSGIDIAGLM